RAHTKGRVRPGGNKNAAFPAIAAALLTAEPVTIRNLPDIDDVRTMLTVMQGLGVAGDRADRHTVTLRAGAITRSRPRPDMLKKLRAALVLMGALLAREGRAEIGHSGGDQIGRRRVDTHVLGLCALGAEARSEGGVLHLEAARLHGADILLDEASVTGTENVILAAVRADGPTVLRNAASEPHVQDLCQLLVEMGARIDGIGSNGLTIHAGAEL